MSWYRPHIPKADRFRGLTQRRREKGLPVGKIEKGENAKRADDKT